MKRTSLTLSILLLFAGGVYAEQLICEKFEGRKNELAWTLLIPDKDAIEGIAVITPEDKDDQEQGRVYFERKAIGKEEDGTPYIYLYEFIYDSGDTNSFYFSPSLMLATYQPQGFPILKCSYSE